MLVALGVEVALGVAVGFALPPNSPVERFGWDKKFILYVSLGGGLVLAFFAPVNVFASPPTNWVAGAALTGLLMGGGASWLHDLLDKPQVAAIPIPPG